MTLEQLLSHETMITGASSGIGYALAENLASAGARSLIISGRKPLKLKEAKESLLNAGCGNVATVVMDQSQIATIETGLNQLFDQGFNPSILVCNVGINPVHDSGAKKIHATDYQQFIDTFTTNVANTFYLVRSCLKGMRESRFGRIFLIGSQAYRYGIPGQSSYNVSKSALVGLMNTLNNEYQKSNITCALFNIGLVRNQRTEKLRKRMNPQSIVSLSEQEVAERILTAMCRQADSRTLEIDIQ